MNISNVKANQRFDQTEFNNVALDGQARSIYAIYTCPNCQEQIRFQKSNFERTRHTNLAPEIEGLFDSFALNHLSDSNHFIDWLCPKCRLAARVYFRTWVGGRHGDYGIDLTEVIEERCETSLTTTG